MRYTKEVSDDARRLLNDLRALGQEAEKVIETSASDVTNGALSGLRDRFASAQERFSDLYGTARKKTLAGAKYADSAIRENPYQTLAVGVAVGLLFGFLLGRSSKNEG